MSRPLPPRTTQKPAPLARPIIPQYLEGRRARRAGLAATLCPYPSDGGVSAERYAWFMGWYDEKHDENPATRASSPLIAPATPKDPE